MSTLQGKPWYAEAGGYEDDGPTNFEAPTTGAFLENQRKENKRLREARAGELAVRSGRLFHEKEASRYGLDSARGLAHLRASRMLKTSSGKFSKMFEDDQTMGQPSPKAQMKVCQAAANFHKQQAQAAGPESDLGQAHIQQMQTHLSNASQIKQQGQQQKQTPFPVPDKKSVPNKDVKQQGKAPIQLPPDAANQGDQTTKLQQGGKEAGEGGPGSGRKTGKNSSGGDSGSGMFSKNFPAKGTKWAGGVSNNPRKDAYPREAGQSDGKTNLTRAWGALNLTANNSGPIPGPEKKKLIPVPGRESAHSIKIENFGQADAERTPKAYKPKTIDQQVGSDLLRREKDDGIERFPANPTNAKTMMTSRRSLRRSA